MAAAQAAAAAAQAAAQRGPAAAAVPKGGDGKEAAASSGRAAVARVAPAAAEAERLCWASMTAAQACSGWGCLAWGHGYGYVPFSVQLCSGHSAPAWCDAHSSLARWAVKRAGLQTPA